MIRLSEKNPREAFDSKFREQLVSEMKRIPFIGVIADPQSYLNVVFLLLGLPLGVAYFVFLVTGISVGFGLTVVWVGVPILALVLLGSWAMCRFERGLVNVLLKQDIARENSSPSLSTTCMWSVSGVVFGLMWNRPPSKGRKIALVAL